MTSPPERVEVACPRCGRLYETWFRPSINLSLEEWTDEELEEATTAVCPECGHRAEFATLIVGSREEP